MSRSSHPPKTAALLALSEGLLSDAGVARLQRHLADCPTCANELRAIAAYETLGAELRQTPLGALEPTLDPEADGTDADRAWAHLEAALPQHLVLWRRLRAWASEGRGAGLALSGGVAVAAALFFVLRPDSPAVPALPAGAPTATAPADAPEDPRDSAPTLAAYLLAGSPEATVSGHPLSGLTDAPPSVRAGDELTTPEDDGFLDVVLAPVGMTGGMVDVLPAGFRVTAGSRTLVEQLERRTVVLRLVAGSVSSQLVPGTLGGPFAVVAGTWRTETLGAHYSVEVAPDGRVTVRVEEGRVTVADGVTSEPVVLDAPARWTSDGSRPGDGEPARPWVGLFDAISAESPPVAFSLPPAAPVSGWVFDDVSAPGGGARLWARPGNLDAERLAALTLDGRRLALQVAPAGGPIPLPAGVTPRAPMRRMGTLPPEAIRAVVQRGRRALRRCYDRALRTTGGDFAADLRLSMRIARTGQVARAEARDVGGAADAPDTLLRCVAARARDWHFPQPEGGPVDVEIPIRFDPSEN